MTCPIPGSGATKNTKQQALVHSSFLDAEFISVSTIGLLIRFSSHSLLSYPKERLLQNSLYYTILSISLNTQFINCYISSFSFSIVLNLISR